MRWTALCSRRPAARGTPSEGQRLYLTERDNKVVLQKSAHIRQLILNVSNNQGKVDESVQELTLE